LKERTPNHDSFLMLIMTTKKGSVFVNY